ncbi:hypothetical protein BDZ89DRAFT_1086188 [Hymenopellis radicata]|nr:hypothetical protein BDZ89DRAFT_1086188 [Hymenopellis radicata]
MSHECPHCGLPPTKKPRRIPTQSPYETHLGTTIAFTAQEHVRVDIVNLVAHAKADITDLDRTKTERNETITFRDAHLALFPPIHQLPVEPYNVFASSRSGPWLLGKVCHRWRQVAWSCTSLWTSFTTLTNGGRAALLEGALSRSLKRNNVIAKSAESYLDHFEPFLKIGKLPSLVALGLEIYMFSSDLDVYYQLLSSLGKHVPQLRRLTLSFADRSYHCIKLQLKELVVPLDCDTSNIPGLQPHSKLSFIDMSHSFAITLLDHIRCPSLTRLSLPCPAQISPTGKFSAFIQRSACKSRLRNLTFDDHETIVDLRLSFGAEPPKGRFIECLSDRTVLLKLRVLTITTTTISRSIWEAELKDTLIRVLSARYQSPEESSTGTNLQEVVVVLGRETVSEEDKRRLREEYGKDCTIEDLVDADFVEFRKLKDRGLDIRLSVWKGRTLIRYV